MSNVYTPALKGVHIDVTLPITRLGQPESFQDVEFLEIRFVNNRLSDQLVVYTADKIKLTDNVVSVVIPDTDSTRLQLGFYDVQFTYRKTNVLRPNQYEPFKLVVPAFSLVATTAELGVDVATDVEVQSVVINGELFIARDGLNGASAFKIWQMAVGTPESTVLDYLAWLRQPAESAATEFEALTEQFNTFNAAANASENTRNTKEAERNENESIRLVDEQLRKNAEAARVLAEQTRQQKESDRETLFDQSVSESAQATAAANTAANSANSAANAQNAYNVTVAVPLAAGVYYTKTTARAAVPVASRKIGLVNTYALSASTWYTEKYIGSNVSGWTTESNWEQVPDAARVAALETDLNTRFRAIEKNGYIYMGVATPSTVPSNQSYYLYYVAMQSGTYANFLDKDGNAIFVESGITVLMKDNSWWKHNLLKVEQATGPSQSSIMSQKAITDNINLVDRKYALQRIRSIANVILPSDISGISSYPICLLGLEMPMSYNNGVQLYLKYAGTRDTKDYCFFSIVDSNNTTVAAINTPINTSMDGKVLRVEVNGFIAYFDMHIMLNEGAQGIIDYHLPLNTQLIKHYQSLPKKGYNKTILAFGDSITKFTGSYPISGYRYSDYIQDISGCSVVNVGIGGTRLSQRLDTVDIPTVSDTAYAALDIANLVKAFTTNNYTQVDAAVEFLKSRGDDNSSIIARLKTVDLTKIDIVTIFAGTNDWAGNVAGTTYNGVALGDIDSINPKEVCGAINNIITMLLNANPRLKIYFFTPIVRWVEGGTNDSYWSDNFANAQGYKLPELASKINEVASKRHIPCFDLYNTLGWDKTTNFKTFFTGSDFTHPVKGFKELAQKMCYYLGF